MLRQRNHESEEDELYRQLNELGFVVASPVKSFRYKTRTERTFLAPPGASLQYSVSSFREIPNDAHEIEIRDAELTEIPDMSDFRLLEKLVVASCRGAFRIDCARFYDEPQNPVEIHVSGCPLFEGFDNLEAAPFHQVRCMGANMKKFPTKFPLGLKAFEVSFCEEIKMEEPIDIDPAHEITFSIVQCPHIAYENMLKCFWNLPSGATIEWTKVGHRGHEQHDIAAKIRAQQRRDARSGLQQLDLYQPSRLPDTVMRVLMPKLLGRAADDDEGRRYERDCESAYPPWFDVLKFDPMHPHRPTDDPRAQREWVFFPLDFSVANMKHTKHCVAAYNGNLSVPVHDPLERWAAYLKRMNCVPFVAARSSKRSRGSGGRSVKSISLEVYANPARSGKTIAAARAESILMKTPRDADGRKSLESLGVEFVRQTRSCALPGRRPSSWVKWRVPPGAVAAEDVQAIDADAQDDESTFDKYSDALRFVYENLKAALGAETGEARRAAVLTKIRDVQQRGKSLALENADTVVVHFQFFRSLDSFFELRAMGDKETVHRYDASKCTPAYLAI